MVNRKYSQHRLSWSKESGWGESAASWASIR